MLVAAAVNLDRLMGQMEFLREQTFVVFRWPRLTRHDGHHNGIQPRSNRPDVKICHVSVAVLLDGGPDLIQDTP